MKKTLNILLLFLAITSHAQDLIYTQSFGSPLYLNPAFAGSLAKTSFYLNARQQWPSLSGGYIASSLSANHRFDNANSGIGLIIKSEEQGAAQYRALDVSGIYSYIIHINRRWTAAPGIQCSYLQAGFDRSTFVFGDQLEDDFTISQTSSETVATPTSHLVDFSSGFIVFDKQFWGGVSVHHLAQPINYATQTSLLRKYSVHAGYSIPVENQFPLPLIIAPSAIVNVQGPFTRIGTNVVCTYSVISVGTGISNVNFSGSGKDIINSFLLLGYSDEHFKVGYSYDFTVLHAVGFGGAHEISLGVWLNYDNNSNPNPLKHKKIRKVSCPKF